MTKQNRYIQRISKIVTEMSNKGCSGSEIIGVLEYVKGAYLAAWMRVNRSHGAQRENGGSSKD